jgi:N-glycosylase/DNA lyase
MKQRKNKMNNIKNMANKIEKILDRDDKIYNITSDVQDFLGDSEEFRIDLGIELKKMKELNEALIDTYSDLVSEYAERNLFLIKTMEKLLKEKKVKEDSNPLRELIKEFENENALENDEKRNNLI